MLTAACGAVWADANLPRVVLTQQAKLVSVPGPAHHLSGYQDVQQAEHQEVEEQKDGRQVVGGPVKHGGLDQQEGHCHHC